MEPLGFHDIETSQDTAGDAQPQNFFWKQSGLIVLPVMSWYRVVSQNHTNPMMMVKTCPKHILKHMFEERCFSHKDVT